LEIIKILVDNGINLNQTAKNTNGSLVRIVDAYKTYPSAKSEIIEYLKSKGVKF